MSASSSSSSYNALASFLNSSPSVLKTTIKGDQGSAEMQQNQPVTSSFTSGDSMHTGINVIPSITQPSLSLRRETSRSNLLKPTISSSLKQVAVPATPPHSLAASNSNIYETRPPFTVYVRTGGASLSRTPSLRTLKLKESIASRGSTTGRMKKQRGLNEFTAKSMAERSR